MVEKNIKSVILMGGNEKGTRFRPLSLELPKPLFPIGGFPMVEHQIEACSKIPMMKEILLIGFFQYNEALTRFVYEMKEKYGIQIRYLQEYAMLGTAGSIYHFRDIILSGRPEAFFVIFSDVFCNYPLKEMLEARQKWMKYMIMGVELAGDQSCNYGVMGINDQTKEIVHYIEKPKTFVSKHINAGVYLLDAEVFDDIGIVFDERYENNVDSDNLGRISFENDIFTKIAGQGKMFSYVADQFWMAVKSAGSAVYANQKQLEIFKKTHPERLSGDTVYVHPSAQVDPTAKLGPYASIGANAKIGPGVRVRNSIVLDNAVLKSHSCVLNSIVGWHSQIGEWTRVEGTATKLDPDAPHATTDNFDLFDGKGKLRPSVTILGRDVIVPNEVVILNSVVLPNKDMSSSWGLKNQILL
jgi:mannose-1-phosphate guanylyltransferase